LVPVINPESGNTMKKKIIVSIATLSGIVALGVGVALGFGSTTVPESLGAPGVDIAAFKDGSLTQPIAEEPCTLTNGDETTCYRIIVTGHPVDTTIGPFCPETTNTNAEDSGIWLDGSTIYDADGQFIVDLSTIYGDAKWKLYDDSGNVNVTDSKEAFQGAARPDVQEEYKYHCVEGKFEWTNTGEAVPISVLVPVNPVSNGAVTTTTGADLGITTNGLVIAASAPVDAILGAYTIAAFDDCGGHFNPIEGYHLHAYTDCQGATYGNQIDDPNAETALVGYALDGVAVFAPLAHDTTIQLDECNGRTTDKDGYHYYAQSPELNRVVKCFKGLTAVDESQATGPGGPPPGGLASFINPSTIPWVIAGGGVLVAGVTATSLVIHRRRTNKR
jgi:hypothetical protein